MKFEITTEVMDDVDKAARVVVKSYPRTFELDDVRQAIVLAILENPKAFANAKEKGEAVLFAAYKRAGFRYCQGETVRYVHYSDQWVYSSEEVKSLLPEYFRALGDPSELPEARINTEKAVIKFADLDEAYGRLRPSHKRVLAKRYNDKETLTRSEQNTHSKAIKLLTHYVNYAQERRRREEFWHDGPKLGNRLPTSHALKTAGEATMPEEYYKYHTDPLVEYQKLMERNHV